jgi:predicted flap endonuclease-1-like 5' DNA nuclease
MFFNDITLSFSIELFFWMLGSFLIGYFFAIQFYDKKNSTTTKKTTIEDSILDEPEKLVIRAIKTFERGGIEIKKSTKLNFDSIGIASKNDKDDLCKIKGIGSVIEKKLNRIGIFTYKQLSNSSDVDLEAITRLIQFFPGRIKSDDWRGQANKLLKDNKS